MSYLSIAGLQLELGIEDNAFVGLSCGSLYPDKRIDFLVKSAEIIRQSISNFHLIIICLAKTGHQRANSRIQRETRHYIQTGLSPHLPA